jgi:hypothetical protein
MATGKSRDNVLHAARPNESTTVDDADRPFYPHLGPKLLETIDEKFPYRFICPGAKGMRAGYDSWKQGHCAFGRKFFWRRL